MILGIDVSRWQSKVDWSLMKSNGVEFVFIKATQGNYMTDQMMVKHVEGANKAGMIILTTTHQSFFTFTDQCFLPADLTKL